MEDLIDKKLRDIGKYGDFTVEARTKLLENYWKEIPQLYQYAQALTSILGLIAGFGFTAFQYIHNKNIFFIGEILVTASILYLLYKVKTYTAVQPVDTEKMINDFSEKAREIKIAIKENNTDKIASLEKEFAEKVKDTSTVPQVQMAKILSDSLEKSFWSGAVGIGLIFASFFIC